MKGRPKLFQSPQELWDHFLGYKAHIELNPIIEKVWLGKDAIEKEKRHLAPPTWKGFEAYLFRSGVGDCANYVDLDKYRRNVNEAYGDFSGIVRAIGSDMFDTKFSKAAVNMYNPNIIARELGLADAQEVVSFQRPILEGGKELPNENEVPIDDLLK